jgi:hypothetical protein
MALKVKLPCMMEFNGHDTLIMHTLLRCVTCDSSILFACDSVIAMICQGMSILFTKVSLFLTFLKRKKERITFLI